MTSSLATRWLPFGVPPASRFRLLCLPHAGAGASTYRAWGAGLPPDVTVCPVQLPGRESRLFEEPYYQIQPLVRDLAGELSQLDELYDRPYAVFGHSLGTIVGFELVRQIGRLGRPSPVHLFVAGRQAPHLPSGQPDLRALPLPELAGALRELGGTPAAVLDDPAVLELIAPLLRADFTLNETYEYTAEAPLPVPVTAFAATADPRGGQRAMAAWRDHTSRAFQLYPLPGGHFAVLRHAAFVHTRILDELGLS